MENALTSLGIGQSFVDACENIVFAIIALVIGIYVARAIARLVTRSRLMTTLDPTVQSFAASFVRIGLYILVGIIVISILGVPMASVITVLASAGLAVGLALQGTLTNLAAGIMLMILRPFKVGDYIDAAGSSGTVKELTLFSTVLITIDNRRVIIPNGSVVGSTIVNYSSEDLRRVDLEFATGKGEIPADIQKLCLEAVAADPRVLKDPAPFARLSGATNEASKFTVRAWCKNADYWDVYFDLIQEVSEAMDAANVSGPAVRITGELAKRMQ